MSLRPKRHDRTGGPVVCAVLSQHLRNATFKIFSLVAVRSLNIWRRSAATDGWVWTPQLKRPFFTVNYMHTHGSSLCPHSFHHMWSLCLLVLSLPSQCESLQGSPVCLFFVVSFLVVNVSVPVCFPLFRCWHTALDQGPTRLKFAFIPHCTRMCHRCECSPSSFRLQSLHLLTHHLSCHQAVPTARHLPLPLPLCGGQIPCVLPLRTLAPWPRESLPQVMSPTTTSSQRLMSNTPRSPRASNGSLMTTTTMSSPSATRSLTRAEDDPITLKQKACRPVCRR